MLRLIISDYISNFKPAIKRIGENNGWFGLVYIMCVLPMIIGSHDSGTLRYYISFAPAFMGVYFTFMYPTGLHKNMYLCPMSDKDKESYLKMFFWSKIIIFEAVVIIISSVSVLAGVIRAWEGAYICVVIGSMLITSNVVNDGLSKKSKKRKKSVLKGETIFDTTAILIGAVNSVLIIFNNDEPLEAWEIVLIVILLIAQLITTVVVFSRKYSDVFRLAVSYEWVYGTVDNENNN